MYTCFIWVYTPRRHDIYVYTLSFYAVEEEFFKHSINIPFTFFQSLES